MTDTTTGAPSPVRLFRPKAGIEAVCWDGSAEVLVILEAWGAEPVVFPGQPLRIWGARDGYAGALAGDWLVRDPSSGACRWVPELFADAFEEPAEEAGTAGLTEFLKADRDRERLAAEHYRRTCEELEGELAGARAAERERIRELAVRAGAVCTGGEGTSCYFADLIGPAS